MRVLRTALLAVGSATVLLASTPANAAGVVIVEGEAAVSFTAGCGDGGDAMDMGPAFYGSRQTMFFPASGCSADFETSAQVIQAAEIVVSGVAPLICGTVTVAGPVTGSATFCVANDTAVTVNLTTPAVSASGEFTVTWTTGPGTPSYANLFLDYLVGVGA